MSLRSKTISGVKWTSVSTITLAIVGLLKISVLARFLDAADFGLMALVTFVLGFMNLFMDMGLTSAILHKQDTSDDEYASLYWINVIFSLILFGLISLASPYIASFYDEPELTVLIPLMAISIMLSAMGRQFKTVEQKHLNFRYIAITDIIGAVFGLVVGVITAIWGYGVYALVYAALTQYAISNVIYFVKGLWDRGMLFHFNYEETKPFLNIGIYQVGGQVINYFNRDLDILLIGKFFGSEVLGGYDLAKKLVRHPLKIINPIIKKVGVSVFPRYQDDHSTLRKYFLKLFNGMGAVNAFVYGSIAICAHWLVLILYGSDFLHIILFVQLFTVVTYLRSMAGNVGILVITTGRTDYEFYWNLLITLITPVAIFLGAFYSAEIIIILLGVIQLLMLIPGWYMFFYRLIDMEFWPFIKAQIFPMSIAIIVFLVAISTLKINSMYQFGYSGVLLILLATYSYFAVSEVKNMVKKLLRKYARI